MRFVIMALLAVGLRAQGWTKTDVALEGLVLGLMAYDWGQTLDIERHNAHPDRYPMPGRTPYYEKNPYLGRNPSRGAVNRYFVAYMLGHVAVSHALGHGKARTTFQAATIFYQYNVVSGNHSIGLRCSF